MANPNDITAYRRKVKRKKWIKNLIIFAIVIVAFALIWFNAETIFEPLNGIGSRIDTRTSQEVGFPVELPGSAEYVFRNFNDNFVLLTDTYLYHYDAKVGKQFYAYQHGFGAPMMVTGDNRIVLYNYNGHEFTIFSKSNKIYEGKLEDKIIASFIGNNDMVGIVTDSKRYSNVLYIYDRSGRQKFSHKFIDENVTDVDFSTDGSSVYVSLIRVQNGTNQSVVNKYSLTEDSGEIWSYLLTDGAWALDILAGADSVNILGDTSFYSIDAKEGGIIGSYSYDGALDRADLGESINVLTIANKVTNANILVALDKNSEVISSKSMPYNLKQVEIDGDLVYTLEGASIKCYNSLFEEQFSVQLSEEYDGFIVIDGFAYLLGYDVVERVDMSEPEQAE